MENNELLKFELEEKIKNEKLVPDSQNPGEFIPAKINSYGTILNFLNPENWIFHKSIVDKVLAGDYMGIRPYSAEFVTTLNCTNRCRGPCSYCLQRMNEGIQAKNDFKNQEVHMPGLEFAKGLMDKLIDGGIKGIIFTGGGEPSLFRNLEDIMMYTAEKKVDFVFYTNGNSISNSRIIKIAETAPKLVRISLNCGTKEGYNHFHNPANPENAFTNTLSTIESFARESIKNPNIKLGVGFIINQDNWTEIPQTALRLREIIDKTGGGISFAAYRPAFNYCGTKQTDPKIIDQAYELVESKVRKILNNSGIDVANVKCRYEAVKGEERGYQLCRASGLFAELGPSGKLYSCCDRNCFRAFAIGDLKKNSLEEIYAGEERKVVMSYANNYSCTTCAIACKPHETNKQFEKIEQLRAKGEMYKVEAWIKEYDKRAKPKLVNF